MVKVLREEKIDWYHDKCLGTMNTLGTCWAKTHIFHFFSRLNPAPYVNRKRHKTSWMPPRHNPFISPKNLMVSSSEWRQSVSQLSFETLSPLKGHKKRKKHFQIKAIKTKDMEAVSSKWETTSLCFERDANIVKGKSLQAEESNQQRSMQTPPHLTKNKDKQPNKSSIQSAKGRNNLALHCSDNCGWKITYAYVLKGERKERETPSSSLSLFLPVHMRMRMLKYKF